MSNASTRIRNCYALKSCCLPYSLLLDAKNVGIEASWWDKKRLQDMATRSAREYISNLIEQAPMSRKTILNCGLRWDIELFAIYMEQLTRGLYDTNTLTKACRGLADRRTIEMLIEALREATDVIIIANYLTSTISDEDDAQDIVDIREGHQLKEVENFHNNGGLQILELFYNGMSIEDIVPIPEIVTAV